ncbi:MAG: EamA family transporter [Opitutaceae bacterium]|nr:EamA family transporter [Opitutaceae bacterium]
MLAAILTTAFFAATAPIARRAAQLLGPATANLARLALAALILGLWALLFGRGFGAAWLWFFASGVVGFGLGGFLMFQALPRAGSNLANLVVQCGSAVTAMLVEWAWLGVGLGTAQLACVVAILAGVVIGLAPSSFPQLPAAEVRRGAVFAILSALGQGCGAVLSRKAFAAVRAGGATIDPGTATLERIAGGVLVAALAWVIVRTVRGSREPTGPVAGPAWPWVLANTLTGPVLGVTCMQWALSTTPAGIVQPIVAMAPLFTAPLAFGLGENLPRRRYFVGTIVAFVATVVLWRLK